MSIEDEIRRDQPMSTEIQKLASRLWRQVQKDGKKVVLVTSALRGEGKSTTVAYLASALALQPGRKIVAMDTDFRDPTLNRHFHAEIERGLADVLRGECSVRDAVVHTVLREGDSGLDLLLPAGDEQEPEALLQTSKLTEVFRTLRSGYDMVLVDAPALIPVADGASIIPHCDAVILVVMAGLSTKHHLRRARELCLGLGAEILGVVVGNVQQAAPEYMDLNYYAYAGRERRSRPRESS
ncbi:MAG TPA: CpsD/CapB family tyrosine-protein kinase [Candidatus Krumholzibacteria bacterium]|nr:CpsD/CapB family tyrosine-protein kinase [Candidatus Krumholzibacteria bacterium]